ncbi:Protein required for ethanol metabolism [Venturia effusa]|uniref:Protein required for ethanol metabolism n=1 Tax=Venturia effusa TaxID=50376 RepID=A0A517L6D5_9PEZI|nr:Protein required for ethanol metabolism [Venturia effusa]
MLKWYQAKLASRPLLTQSLTTMVLFATGDTLAQQGVERRGLANQDLKRTGRMALYGGAIFGPAATTWFSFLQRRVILGNNPSSNATILTRVALDQLIFTPANLLCFLSSQAVMEGTSPRAKIESTYGTAITKNWMVWPWVQLVNFKVVPLEHRVLVVNVVSLGWNCYLSYLNSQPGGGQRYEVEGTFVEKVEERVVGTIDETVKEVLKKTK